MRSSAAAVIISLLVSGQSFAQHAGLKKRLAVMDMSITNTAMAAPTGGGGTAYSTTIAIPPPTDFAMALTEVLTTELARTGKFIVLERKSIADINAEQELGASGKVNAETASKAGSIIGAQVLVRCAISEYSYTQTGTSSSLKVIKGLNLGATMVRALVGIDTRVYDAKTSEVLASTVTRGTATAKGADIKISNARMDASAGGFATTPLGQASREALAGAVQFIVEKLGSTPWEARVIRVDGKDIYLNAGEESGVTPGATFGIYHGGAALIDPASGTDLGTPDTQVGVLRIKTVRPKYAVAELVSGELPQRNDVVRSEKQGVNP
jgi:curli biogenesis system outer membrane secretion channel CsgG